MARTARSTGESTKPRRAPAQNPEDREQQMINLAVNYAEQQMLNGTASSQIVTHFLKLATAKERLEREKLESENLLLKAKSEQLKDAKTQGEMYAKALNAMRSYVGGGEPTDDDEEL